MVNVPFVNQECQPYRIQPDHVDPAVHKLAYNLQTTNNIRSRTYWTAPEGAPGPRVVYEPPPEEALIRSGQLWGYYHDLLWRIGDVCASETMARFGNDSYTNLHSKKSVQ